MLGASTPNISSIGHGGDKCPSSRRMVHARTHGRTGRRYWWVWLFPGLRLGGNRQVVAAEYRRSAAFFVYEVRWNALIRAVILMNGRQVSRMTTHEY